MKLYWLLLCIPFLLGAVVNSTNYKVDFVVKPAAIHENITVVFSPFSQNTTKGHVYAPTTTLQPSDGDGHRPADPKRALSILYDVFVDVHKDSYYQNKKVTATIIIANMGDDPDKDAILTMYLQSPSLQNYSRKVEYRKEINITCPLGNFNLTSMKCNYNGEELPANALVINQGLKLPSKSELGQWYYVVEYNSTAQPVIIVSDGFEVKKFPWWIIILISVILLGLYLHKRKIQIEMKGKKKLLPPVDDDEEDEPVKKKEPEKKKEELPKEPEPWWQKLKDKNDKSNK